MEKLQLLQELQKIWIKANDAKIYVDDGKEVLCSNKLQGLITNLTYIIEQIAKEIKEKTNELVQKSSD
jgi:hypothetical protein